MRFCLIAFLLSISFSIGAQEASSVFKPDVRTDKKPWTHLNFKNNPDNFQFAIVTDNTGGMRRPVFESAVVKLNMIQPEFVMCVGDLIEGYTTNQEQIDKEWLEFNGWLGNLEMPFFYLPGNHDISNATMQKDWEQRYGVRYYAFTYRNVLFICMDTDDKPKPEWFEISKEQEDYILGILDKNREVRHTFFFMHHPVWNKESKAFLNIEAKLKQEGRKYTMFAGHNHRYMHHLRLGKDYYTLATTGGGSPLLGPEVGTFDHVTWVTMTDDGPVMANLWLDGILDMDLVNEKTESVVRAVEDASNLPFKMKDLGNGKAELELKLENKSEHPLSLSLQFLHHHQLQITPNYIEIKLPSGFKEKQKFDISINDIRPLDNLSALDVMWTINALEEEFNELQLTGIKRIELVEKPKKK